MKPLSPKDLGAIVREARVAAELTQAELGERMGASRFWVAAFERGKPRAELGRALKALHALGLTLTIVHADQKQTPPDGASRPNVDVDTSEPVVDLAALLAGSTAAVSRRGEGR